MQSASGKRGRARSPQKMRAVEFKNKKPTVSNLLTVGLVLRYKKTPLPRRASSFKQKKRVRTRIASRLSLGSVDKKDTRHKRERKAVIKQKPRTRLARRGSRLGLRYKKDTLLFEKKNIFFGHAPLLFKYSISSITQINIKCKKSRYRETPTAHGLPAFLCTCFLAKGLCDFKSAYETDADFLFGKYGDSFNDAVH